MDKKKIKAEAEAMTNRAQYEDLESYLLKCRTAYGEGSPIITDAEYDQMMQVLRAVEENHPEWVDAASPARTVDDPVRNGTVKVQHDVPMLSIRDVFEKDDVAGFVGEVQEKAGGKTAFVVEQKIDGLSLTLVYDEDGSLVRAETRGDGYIGEDVTPCALEIQNIPKKIPEKYAPVQIRGEVYMRHEDLEALNAKQEEAGEKTYKNTRNCAAGTLRSIDPAVIRDRKLHFFAFNVQKGPKSLMESHICGMQAVKKDLHIPVVPGFYCTTAEAVLAAVDKIGEMRGDLGYDIDGAVIKLDSLALREEFPAGGSKYSPGHVAFKYPPEEKKTVLRNIEITVGMTGKIVPTAVFDPVHLCGTTVSRATLHNQDFIDKLGIGIGDTLTVYKSGEIIPRVKAASHETRPEGVGNYVMPDICPACGSICTRLPGEADLKCRNASCPAQLKGKLRNFASRDNMDIRGLGDEAVEALVEGGFVKDFADIYSLEDRRDELIEQNIVGREKATNNLLVAIGKSKGNDAWRVLAGLGIENVGTTLSKPLMKAFRSIRAIADADMDELTALEGVGPVLAANIMAFFADKKNREILERMEKAGVNMEAEAPENEDTSLAGLTFVITGDVHIYRNRNEFKASVENRGGKVSGSVSKKTDYLVINDGAGSTSKKAVTARNLNIPLLTEEEFIMKFGK